MKNKLTEGSVFKGMMLFAFPVILSMLAGQLYSTVDSMIIGRCLNAASLAEVSMSMQVILLFMFISSGMEMGCGLLVASKRPLLSDEDMSRLLYNLLFIDIVLGIIMVIAGVFGFEKLLTLINTPEEIMEGAMVYGRIYMAFMLFQMVYDVSREMMIGMGDSRSPLRIMLFTSVMNVILDLIMVPAYGVGGAAFATGISQVTGFIVVLFMLKKNYLKGGFSPTLLKGEYGRDILRLAPPNAIQQASITISSTIKQALLGSIGTMAIAGFACFSKLNALAMMPLGGFCQAYVVFMAQNIAAGKNDRVKEAKRIALRVIWLYEIVIIGLFFFGNRLLVGLFTDDENAMVYGCMMLAFGCFSCIITATRHIMEGQLRARQQMGRYLISNITTIAVDVIFALILVGSLGFKGFYMSMYISSITGLCLAVLFNRLNDQKVEKDYVL